MGGQRLVDCGGGEHTVIVVDVWCWKSLAIPWYRGGRDMRGSGDCAVHTACGHFGEFDGVEGVEVLYGRGAKKVREFLVALSSSDCGAAVQRANSIPSRMRLGEYEASTSL